MQSSLLNFSELINLPKKREKEKISTSSSTDSTEKCPSILKYYIFIGLCIVRPPTVSLFTLYIYDPPLLVYLLYIYDPPLLVYLLYRTTPHF